MEAAMCERHKKMIEPTEGEYDWPNSSDYSDYDDEEEVDNLVSFDENYVQDDQVLKSSYFSNFEGMPKKIVLGPFFDDFLRCVFLLTIRGIVTCAVAKINYKLTFQMAKKSSEDNFFGIPSKLHKSCLTL
jgi:hypothetical protein